MKQLTAAAPRYVASWLRISCLLLPFCHCASANADDTSAIAKQAQNPIASVISIPFQNSTTFDVGQNTSVQDQLLIEPVVPLSLNADWNLITRTIVPVIDEPALASDVGRTAGIGDVQPSFYFSPAKPSFGWLIWGLGPSFAFPTASDRSLGSGKDSVGLSTALLTIRGHWLLGVLATDIASVGGQEARKDVHSFLMQPFVDYNMSHGWYLASSPIITANWKASPGNKWTVPVGGGGGKILHLGHQAVNAYIQAFDNVVTPPEGGNWTLRFQIQLLFPK